MRFHTILVIIILVVACNEYHLRKLCWQEYTKVKLCYPKLENCLIAGQDIGECRKIFQSCIMRERTHPNTSFCLSIIANKTGYKIMSESEWHQNNLDNTLNHFDKDKSQKENNCDDHNLRFKNSKPKTTNSLIKKMSALASSYCPCWEKQDGEVNRASKMNTPLQMWYGGFSTKKCWRELDRFLVENLCGVPSAALEINHIWAKRADCHENLYTLEDPNKSECHQMFFSALKEHANISLIQSTCKLYSEMIEAYLPFSETLSLDYEIININTLDIRYLQPFEYRDDRLYLINSFNDSTHFTCYPVKREISSCIYIHEHCKTHENIEKCGENLVHCLNNISSTHKYCKTLLIPTNDTIGILENIYEVAVKNKIESMIILWLFWTLIKRGIERLVLLIATTICLKLSDVFDYLKNEIDANTEEIKRLSENLNIGENGLLEETDDPETTENVGRENDENEILDFRPLLSIEADGTKGLDELKTRALTLVTQKDIYNISSPLINMMFFVAMLSSSLYFDIYRVYPEGWLDSLDISVYNAVALAFISIEFTNVLLIIKHKWLSFKYNQKLSFLNPIDMTYDNIIIFSFIYLFISIISCFIVEFRVVYKGVVTNKILQ